MQQFATGGKEACNYNTAKGLRQDMANTEKPGVLEFIGSVFWGLIFIGLGIFLELRPDNFITYYIPWLKTYPWILFVLGVFSLIAGGVFFLYEAHPIPDEYVSAQEPLRLRKNEAWRKPT